MDKTIVALLGKTVWRILATALVAAQLAACGSVLDALPGGGGSSGGSNDGSGGGGAINRRGDTNVAPRPPTGGGLQPPNGSQPQPPSEETPQPQPPSEVEAQPPAGTLSGVAKDGLIRGASVNVYAWNGVRGELLGSGMTDGSGKYSLTLQVTSQPVLLEVSGGSYVEEATRRNISLNSGEFVYALQNYTAGQPLTTSITYYTTLATGLAENLVQIGIQPPDAIEAANTRLGNIIGIDTTQIGPSDILEPDSVSVPEFEYSFATAALSSLTERISILNDSEPHRVFTSIRFIQAAYDDLRADGVLNGRGVNGDVVLGRIRLTSQIYRHELALHILRIANNRTANGTGRGPMQMFDLARRLNDSTDPIFGGDPVIPIDSEKPNVSAIVAQEFPNLQNGAVVFGGLSLSAMVTTFPGAASAQLVLDGQVIGTAMDPENPVVRLETVNPPIADGRRTLAFRVTDISGAVGESPPLEVNLSNQQTAIGDITIAGQVAGGPAAVIVGKRDAMVTADIVDPARPQQVEFSVRPQGATAFATSAIDIPNSGAAMLQSSASVPLGLPQFVDGDATLRVAVTNSAGFVFSREVPFVIDDRDPVVDSIFLDQIFRELPGGMFFERGSGEPCAPRQPNDPADSCLLYLQPGIINAVVRDDRAIDRVMLTADGSAVAVSGMPQRGFDNVFTFNLPSLGPDGSERMVTVTAVDKAQNTSAARELVVFDSTAPFIIVSGLSLPGGGNILESNSPIPIDDNTGEIVFGGVVEDAVGLASVGLSITPGVPLSSSVVFMEGRTRARVEVRINPSAIPANITNFSVGIGEVVDRAGNFIFGSNGFAFTRAIP